MLQKCFRTQSRRFISWNVVRFTLKFADCKYHWSGADSRRGSWGPPRPSAVNFLPPSCQLGHVSNFSLTGDMATARHASTLPPRVGVGGWAGGAQGGRVCRRVSLCEPRAAIMPVNEEHWLGFGAAAAVDHDQVEPVTGEACGPHLTAAHGTGRRSGAWGGHLHSATAQMNTAS